MTNDPEYLAIKEIELWRIGIEPNAPDCAALHLEFARLAWIWAVDVAPYYAVRYYVSRNKNHSMSDPTLLVLASLSEGDKHGYAMMEDIERFTGLRLGPGTLYGAITRLEKRGWIKPVKVDDRRRPYTLTAAGREYRRPN